MHKLIKTFYFWIYLISLCNVASLGFALPGLAASPKHLWLYPLAWLLQLPLVLVLALAHHGINHALAFLPKAGSRIARFSVCCIGTAIFTALYAASQRMYMEINAFAGWDTLRVAFAETLQLLPDIARGNGPELASIGLFAVAAAAIYTRRYHTPAHYPKVFAVALAVFTASGAGSFALVNRVPTHLLKQVRGDVLPTTYLTFSIIDDLLPATWPAGFAVADMALEPCISLETYFAAHPMKPETNVFFIMLESVSWNHYGFMGYPRNCATPHLDALAGDSLVFPRTYAAANHSNYSQTSVHASQYPLRRNYLDQFDRVDYPKTLLFDILAHAGYQTAFFSAQNEDWQGMKSFIQANTELQHFFHSKTELGGKIGIESKIDDQLVRQRAIDFLDRRDPDRPLFMYLNFQNTHFPYDLNSDAARPYRPCSTDHFEFQYFAYDQNHLENVVNKYDNALHYVDAQIGVFIEHLKQARLYENSLIVVAADHGEAFYERGYPTHSTTLYDDQIRTCTLFKLPERRRHEIRRDAISLIDINPTILEILGQPNHPNFQGRPVCEKPRGGFIYLLSHAITKTHGIVDYPWKYISCRRDGERLVNVELDPTESTDLSAAHPETAQRLKQELNAYQQRQMYYYAKLSAEERAAFYPPQHFPAR